MTDKVVCITGSGVRIGAHLADVLHHNGWRIILHGRHSVDVAQQHADRLNAIRPDSVCVVQGDLLDTAALTRLAQDISQCFGRLDALIHNASSFFSTPMGQATLQDWDDLMGSNARAPFFLTQALLPILRQSKGVVLSMIDIHANGQPFADYPIYNMAKAAHRMMVQALAKDLAPEIRVNGISLGANLWPDDGSISALDAEVQSRVMASIPMQRVGTPDDLAAAVCYLLDASYVTGQILAVDGGRSLTIAGE
jgi:pteridine reductase